MTYEDEQEIIRLYMSGISTKNLARLLDISTSTIQRKIRKYGAFKRLKYKTLDEQEIIRLYLEEGKTTKEIADIFNISTSTIKRRIQKHNIQKGPKYSLNQDAFAKYTNESCYWAGFMAADAWVGSNHIKKKFIINLAQKDKHHLQKMCIFLEREPEAIRNKIVFNKERNKTYKQAVLEVGNAKIVSDVVKNFNIVQAKSFILRPPIQMPERFILHYIRGFFDGDGHIGKNLKIFNIVSGSYFIIAWIRDIIEYKFGWHLNIHKPQNIWTLQTSCNRAMSIFHWLYKDSTSSIRLDRKHERYLNFCKNMEA